MDTKLIKVGELSTFIGSQLAKQREIMGDCQRILPFVHDATMKASITKKMAEAKDMIEALERGYVPVQDTWGFHRVETKSKWSAKAVKDTLRTMPEEVKAVWDKVKADGFFDSFSVTVRGGGDPLLVGNKGKHRFLIGAWLYIAEGYSIGFTVKR